MKISTNPHPLSRLGKNLPPPRQETPTSFILRVRPYKSKKSTCHQVMISNSRQTILFRSKPQRTCCTNWSWTQEYISLLCKLNSYIDTTFTCQLSQSSLRIGMFRGQAVTSKMPRLVSSGGPWPRLLARRLLGCI